MSRTMGGLLMGVALAWTLTASAAESTNTVAKQNSPAAVLVTTNAADALKAQEQALDLQTRTVTQQLIDLVHPIWAARQKAMADDSEVRALNAEIAAKQAEIEKRLMAKDPNLAAMTKQREELMRQHAELSARLKDLRKKLDEMTTNIPAKAETK